MADPDVIARLATPDPDFFLNDPECLQQLLLRTIEKAMAFEAEVKQLKQTIAAMECAEENRSIANIVKRWFRQNLAR